MATPNNAIPSNQFSPLGEMLRCVRDILAMLPSQLALPPEKRITVTIGKRPTYYEGNPPRVHFRPADAGGSWGDASRGLGGTGMVADAVMVCTAFIWGEPTTDEWSQYDPADALLNQVINALTRVARGNLKGMSLNDPSKPDEDNYGQAYKLRFGYVYGVQRDKEIWALPANPIAPSPPDIGRPPGVVPSTVGPLVLTERVS